MWGTWRNVCANNPMGTGATSITPTPTLACVNRAQKARDNRRDTDAPTVAGAMGRVTPTTNDQEQAQQETRDKRRRQKEARNTQDNRPRASAEQKARHLPTPTNQRSPAPRATRNPPQRNRRTRADNDKVTPAPAVTQHNTANKDDAPDHACEPDQRPVAKQTSAHSHTLTPAKGNSNATMYEVEETWGHKWQDDKKYVSRRPSQARQRHDTGNTKRAHARARATYTRPHNSLMKSGLKPERRCG